MSGEVEKFLRLLQQIGERPSLYVGRPEIRSVATFLDGYAMGAGDVTLRSLGELAAWIEVTYGVCHPRWHWSDILLYGNKDHARACAAIPRHFAELLEHGPLPEPVIDWVEERVAKKRGRAIFEPTGEHPDDKDYPLSDDAR